MLSMGFLRQKSGLMFARFISCLLLVVGFNAYASTWVLTGVGATRIIIPLPSLDGVTAQPFYYGDNASIYLDGFGQTDSIYYQVQTWQDGVYSVPTTWQCQDRATITANQNHLTLPLASGRYKVNSVAVLGTSECNSTNLAKFTAGELISTPLDTPYASGEFMVINDTQLAYEANTIYLQQDPSTDTDGYLDSYDMQMQWPAISGVENSKLTLYKDNIPYYFDIADNSNQYTAVNSYDSTLKEYTSYTGYGEYRYGIRYCYNGLCSQSIEYDTPTTVKPLLPFHLWADSQRTEASFEKGKIYLNWSSDSRNNKFRVVEHSARNNGNPDVYLDLTTAQTVSSVNANDGTRFHRYVWPRAHDGDYTYYIKVCDLGCDTSSSNRREQDIPQNYTPLVLDSDLPNGVIDIYVQGSDKVTGFAKDLNGGTATDGTVGQTNIYLTVNGYIIDSSTTARHQTANFANVKADGNYGFEIDNFAAKLSQIPSLDINQPLFIELHAFDIDYTWEDLSAIQDYNRYRNIASMTITNFVHQDPIAVNDQFSHQVGTTPIMNLTANDYDANGNGLQIIVDNAPASGTLTTYSSNSVKYTPHSNTGEAFEDSFTYRVYDGTKYSNIATVNLSFSNLITNDDLFIVDTGAGNPVSADFALEVGSATKSKTVVRNTSSGDNVSLDLDILANDHLYSATSYKVKLAKAPAVGSIETDAEGYVVLHDGKARFNGSLSQLPDMNCTDYFVISGNEISNTSSGCMQLPMIAQNDPSVGDALAISNTKPTYIDVMANDYLAGSNFLSVKPEIVTEPGSGNGSVSVVEHNKRWQILYEPEYGQVKHNVSFTYKLRKINSQITSMSTATVTIAEINEVPDPVINVNLSMQNGALVSTWQQPSSSTTTRSYEVSHLFSTGPIDEVDAENSWSTPVEVTTLSHSLTNIENGNYYVKVRRCVANSLMCSDWTTSERVFADVPNTENPFTAPDSSQSSYTASVASDNIGTIKGSISVSGGAANYSIALDLPPGRAGMKPSVGLNYSSNGGNGIVGQGWSLAAGGSISRCGAVMDIDGYHGAVRYNAKDKLCLNGQRLILDTGTYGADGSTYYPEMSPTTHVTLHGDWESTTSNFTVKLGSNQTQKFGKNADSVINNNIQSKATQWMLSQTLDAFNNSINFSYDKTSDAGQAYITEIAYTGQGNTDGSRKVVFEYETRPDPKHYYHYGKIQHQTKRLSKVITKLNNVAVNTYDLTYSNHDRKSLLSSLELCYGASASHCLPATYFSVNKAKTDPYGTAALVATSNDFGSNLNYENDYDGDGKLDLVRSTTTGNSEVYLSSNANNTPIALSGLYTHPPSSLAVGEYPSVVGGNMDFNLDGKADFVGLSNRFEGNIIVGWIDENNQLQTEDTGVAFQCYMENGARVYYDSGINHLDGLYRDCSTYVLDVNRDGKLDLLVGYQTNKFENHWKLYVNTHDGSSTNRSTPSFTYVSGANINPTGGLFGNSGIDSPMRVMDFNGDGFDDLVGFYEWGYHGNGDEVYNKFLVRFYPTFTVPEGQSHDTAANLQNNLTFTEHLDQTVLNDYFDIRLVDVNSDGFTDMLYTYGETDERKLYARINNGNGLLVNSTHNSTTSIWHSVGHYKRKGIDYYMSGYYQFTDYDRDGLIDMVIPTTVAAPSLYPHPDADDKEKDNVFDLYNWLVVRGKFDENGSFYFNGSYDLNIVAPLKDLQFRDINGDGYTDAVTRLGRNTRSQDSNGTWVGNAMDDYYNDDAQGIVASHNINTATDLVTAITNGLGHRIELDYGILTDEPATGETPLYRVDSSQSTFPVLHFHSTDTVVKAMHTDNGFSSDNTNTVRFYYANARFHKKGRGFQGFGKIFEVNERAGKTVETHYRSDFPFSNLISERYSYLTDGGSSENFLTRNFNRGFYKSSATAPYVSYFKYSGMQINSLDNATGAGGSVKTTKLINRTVNAHGLPTQVITDTCDGGSLTEDTDDIVLSCSGSPWHQTTKVDTTYTDDGEVIYRPESVTTEQSVSYGDNRGYSQFTTKAIKETFYTNDWQVDYIETKDLTEAAAPYEIAPDIKQTFTYETTGLKQGLVKRVTTTSTDDTAERGINETRWQQTGYSDDGYFATTTHNSEWGESVSVTTTEYMESTGLVEQVTDVNGNVVTNTYDDYRRLKRVSNSTGTDATTGTKSCTQGAYDCQTTHGLVEKYRTITKQAGSPDINKYYDRMGRLVRTLTWDFNNNEVEATTAYNRKGAITGQYDAAGQVTYSEFDALNRPTVKVVDYAPQNYRVNYDFAGLTTTATITPLSTHGNSEIRTITRTTNSAGKLMVGVDEVGHSTYYRYNAQGLPNYIEGPNGAVTSARYNVLGHKTQMSDDNQGTTNFKYNALGELRKQTDGNNIELSFEYDALGRMVSRTSTLAGEQTRSWQYDANGTYGQLSLEKLANNDFIRQYEYDAHGRMIKTITTIEGTNYQHDYVFDSNFGRLTGQRSPDGTATYFTYNNKGFLTQESDSRDPSDVPLRHIVDMDRNGLITKVGYRNNLYTTTARNGSGFVTEICTVAGVYDNCQTNNYAQYIQYNEYDSFGNLGQRVNVSQDVVEAFAYDIQDRLTAVSKTGYHVAGTEVITNYGYDISGNLVKKSDFSLNNKSAYTYGDAARSIGNAGPNAVRSIALADNAFGINLPGRTMNMTYDGNGNLLTKTITGGSTGSLMSYRDIVYNSDNKPIQIDTYDGKSTTFAYGSDGMRYKQQTADKITYYIGSYEVEVDRSNNDTTTRAYIGDYALKSRLPNGSVQLHFLHKDRLGSVDTITEGNTYAQSDILAAMIIEQRSFDVFGKARTTAGGVNGDGLLHSDITQRGFTNHEHLGESGLIHMNGRAYDPDVGRFMSVDPIITFPDNGQSLNPYSYVMNNPLKYTDPSGYATQQLQGDRQEQLKKQMKKMARNCESKCEIGMFDKDGNLEGVITIDNGAATQTPAAANSSSSGSKGTSSGDKGTSSGNDSSNTSSTGSSTGSSTASQTDNSTESPNSDTEDDTLNIHMAGCGVRYECSKGAGGGRNRYVLVNPLQPVINGTVQGLINQIRSIEPNYNYQTIRPLTGRGSQYNRGDIVYLQGILRGLRNREPWPPNMGFQGPTSNITLSRGTIVDRYGQNGGYFVSPKGIPFSQRSLPEYSRGFPYRQFEVLKPINVLSGRIAPAFGQQGGGIQYLLPQRVGALIKSGHIRMLSN